MIFKTVAETDVVQEVGRLNLRMNRTLLLIIFVLVWSFAVPAAGFAQGRGPYKKSVKFINGHDARDGRWDGRGPRLQRIRWRRNQAYSYRIKTKRKWAKARKYRLIRRLARY